MPGVYGASFNRRAMRVLSIAHTGVLRAMGRLRYHPLQDRTDIECHLVVPACWKEFGRTMTADPPDDPGVTVHVERIRMPSVGPAKWYLHTYPRMGAIIRELRPDVIHLWEEPWSAVAVQAAFHRSMHAPNASLVLEVDQNILKRLPPPFETIRRQVLSRTDLILARSAEADRVARATGFDGPSVAIGYGVDQRRFKPGCQKSARAEFGLSGFTIGYVGRIIEEKGLDDAVEALARCPAPVNLAILGEGPYLERLMRHAAELKVADRIRLFGWDAPERVARFISALDALVLLTRTTNHVREQFGRVIIEAQSCGVPVIGSECGAIPEVVGAGGWVIPEHDPAALASLLGDLSRDPALLAAAGQAGIAQVAERFSLDRVATTLVGAWRRSMKPQPACEFAAA